MTGYVMIRDFIKNNTRKTCDGNIENYAQDTIGIISFNKKKKKINKNYWYSMN